MSAPSDNPRLAPLGLDEVADEILSHGVDEGPGQLILAVDQLGEVRSRQHEELRRLARAAHHSTRSVVQRSEVDGRPSGAGESHALTRRRPLDRRLHRAAERHKKAIGAAPRSDQDRPALDVQSCSP